MARSSVISTGIFKVDETGIHPTDDFLAAEEPLEIRIVHGLYPQQATKSISVTMRTPGHDQELATGFLFTEGIIKDVAEIRSIKHSNGPGENVIEVELQPGVNFSLAKLDRNFYTTSSCGVCGKTSIEAIKTTRQLQANTDDDFQCTPSTINQLPNVLRSKQNVFTQTGGLHACGLFTAKGDLVLSREDVGRHNALDKLIGTALHQHIFPLHNYLVLLSGRASFELVQKAYMAGIKVVAAVGAPSSLAVQTAEEFGITLIGFVRDQTFNIYAGAQRIKIPVYENSYQG